MFDIVDEIGERLIKVIETDLKSSSVLEMRVLAAKYTSDVIGNVAFGLDCKCKIKTVETILVASLYVLIIILIGTLKFKS